MARSGITLALCVVAAIGGLALVDKLTRNRIDQTQHEWLSKSLLEVLPPGPYDNDPLQSRTLILAAELGSMEAIPVYTVYKHNKPYAAVLSVIAPDGYNGSIELLMGVQFSGEIVGVRVTRHRETPGLGDDIESRRSEWINAFEGESLSTPTVWTVKKQGGKFDSFTGATITPKAVINAVHRALRWFVSNRDAVFPT